VNSARSIGYDVFVNDPPPQDNGFLPNDIFVTHGHGDHWFAAGLLADRFGARVVASAGTIEQMHASVATRPLLWDKVYPGGMIPPSPVTAVTVPGNQFLAQSVVVGGFGPWQAAIDKVEALRPRHIVCGHQNKLLDDDAGRTIAQTRQYLDHADELLRTADTAVGFFNAMLRRYPNHLGRWVLWVGASVIYGVRDHPDEDLRRIIVNSWL
jgi:hypothetical protein